MEELKGNKCIPLFFCTHSENNQCVYRAVTDRFCKYINDRLECESTVAQKNAMVLRLQEFGLKITGEK